MAKKTVEKTRASGTMTEAQYFQKIRSALRNGFRYWKPATKALELASRPYVGENKRQKKEYQCVVCREWFKRTEVQIDHLVPCGTLRSYDDIGPFIEHLTIEGVENYQVLCKPDHLIKTKLEKENRKNIE